MNSIIQIPINYKKSVFILKKKDKKINKIELYDIGKMKIKLEMFDYNTFPLIKITEYCILKIFKLLNSKSLIGLEYCYQYLELEKIIYFRINDKMLINSIDNNINIGYNDIIISMQLLELTKNSIYINDKIKQYDIILEKVKNEKIIKCTNEIIYLEILLEIYTNFFELKYKIYYYISKYYFKIENYKIALNYILESLKENKDHIQNKNSWLLYGRILQRLDKMKQSANIFMAIGFLNN